MPVETPSLFSQVIQEHLELKRRNAELEDEMPLSSYEAEDPFDNHPLFKSEQQARLEETLDGTEPAVVVGGASLPRAEPAPDVVGCEGEPDRPGRFGHFRHTQILTYRRSVRLAAYAGPAISS